MPKLSAQQEKALRLINSKGALYFGNEHGISFATVRKLHELGLVRLEGKMVWTSPALSITPARSYRDWAAYRIDN